MTLTADIIAAIIKAEDEAPVLGQVLEPGEAVTFRVAGVQGDPGPEGPIGPEGPQGERGFDGEIGVMGPQGVMGPEGLIGPQGPKGDDGRDGKEGRAGAKGDAGPKGVKGDTGPQGPAGGVVLGRGRAGGGGATLSDAVPLVESGAGAPGTAGAASRGDHVHPADAGGGGAPATADYLVGTAQAGLSAEIVVGATPGGELGGTWAAPTVDATHSGSSHAGAVSAGLVGPATARTLVSNAFDATGLHYVRLSPQGGVDDFLDEITGGTDGQLLIVEYGGTPGNQIVVRSTVGADVGNAIEFANKEIANASLGEILGQVLCVYSTAAGGGVGRWWAWSLGSYVIHSSDGNTEVIAIDGQIEMLVGGLSRIMADTTGLGFLTKASPGNTAAQQAASTIADLWTALRNYGLLTTGSTAPSVYLPGGTDVAVADGGTGASTAAGARTNLGLGTMAVEGTTAGGDVSGVWPTLAVTDDSHSHGAATAPGSGGAPSFLSVAKWA